MIGDEPGWDNLWFDHGKRFAADVLVCLDRFVARLWRNQGKRLEALDLLVPVYTWFTEGFDAPDLIEAKALLDELA